MSFSRRAMMTGLATVGAAATLPTRLIAGPALKRGRVVVVRESDRVKAVEACLDALEFKACAGRDVAVKANFNSDDPFPASTHPATLGTLLDALKRRGDGGPEQGKRAAPGVFLASDDRCALDAAAIALLRFSGMQGPAARGPIAGTAQLARALTLGLGAPPHAVEMVAVDARAQDVARRIGDVLAGG